ncbi:MAG: MFS transporter [Marinilabiliaceae bacterium]|nr:MFS transporter [Marinilabiliaceae bacterium]
MNATKIKWIYLIVYMAFAVWRVFYNVFLENKGFTGSEIGVLNAIMLATLFVFVPLWGIVADRKGIRPTMVWLVIGSAVCVFFLGEILSFWILLFFIPLLTFFYHPLGPLTDALAIQVADADKKQSYGGLRMWGSLGWSVASIVGGYAFKFVSLNYLFVASAILFVAVIPFLIVFKRKKIYKPNFKSISFKYFVSNKILLGFIVLMTLYGVACSPVNSYLNLYFKELGGGNDIIGYAYAIMAFSEVPFFLLGNRILIRMGSSTVIGIAMAAMVIRMLLYGFVPNIYLGLAVGALQGISLSFFFVGAVAYLAKLIPAGREATSQSIMWTTYIGIGQTTGNLIIGPMIDGTGMVGVMKIFLAVNFLCLVFALTYFYLVNKKKKAVANG